MKKFLFALALTPALMACVPTGPNTPGPVPTTSTTVAAPTFAVEPLQCDVDGAGAAITIISYNWDGSIIQVYLNGAPYQIHTPVGEFHHDFYGYQGDTWMVTGRDITRTGTVC